MATRDGIKTVSELETLYENTPLIATTALGMSQYFSFDVVQYSQGVDLIFVSWMNLPKLRYLYV
jgi:hypothetical protein